MSRGELFWVLLSFSYYVIFLVVGHVNRVFLLIDLVTEEHKHRSVLVEIEYSRKQGGFVVMTGVSLS